MLGLQRLAGNKAVADLIGNHSSVSNADSRRLVIQRVKTPKLPRHAGDAEKRAALHILSAQIGRSNLPPLTVAEIQRKIAKLLARKILKSKKVNSLIKEVNEHARWRRSSIGKRKKLNGAQVRKFIEEAKVALEILGNVEDKNIDTAFRCEEQSQVDQIRKNFAHIAEHLYLWVENHERKVCFNEVSPSGALNAGVGRESILVIGPQAMEDENLRFTLIHEAVHGAREIRGEDHAYWSYPGFPGVSPGLSLNNPDHYVLAVREEWLDQWEGRLKEYHDRDRGSGSEVAGGEVDEDAQMITKVRDSIQQTNGELWRMANNVKELYHGTVDLSRVSRRLWKFMEAHGELLRLTGGFKVKRNRLKVRKKEKIQARLRKEHVQVLIDFFKLLGWYCTIVPRVTKSDDDRDKVVHVAYGEALTPDGDMLAPLRLPEVRGAELDGIREAFILQVIENSRFGGGRELYKWFMRLAERTGVGVPR